MSNDKLKRAALAVAAFDWSDNDEDAVQAIDRLVRLATQSAESPPPESDDGGEYPSDADVLARIERNGLGFYQRRDIIKAACDLGREHREVAEVIPWAEYPDATPAAKDADGTCMLYNCEPHIEVDTRYGDDARATNGDWQSYAPSNGECAIPGPWQDSLRARPENV